MRWRLSLVAVLALPLSAGTVGCGFIFTHGPPEGYEQMDYFTCTESNTGPIVDVIWGGLNVIGAIVVLSDPDEYEERDQLIASGLAWGAISGTAAAVGFSKTSKCRDAKRELAERQADSGLQPQADSRNLPQWALLYPSENRVRLDPTRGRILR